MIKKKKKYTREERTAYHEAGHAVMCYLLRQRFKKVTIIPDKDTLGSVHTTFVKNYWKDIEWSPSPIKVEKKIEIDLAGVVSEYLFTGRHDWKWSAADMHNAVDFASRVVGTDRTLSKYVEYLMSAVEDNLSLPYHKRMIRELAKALLKEKTIGYRKARKIMRQAFEKDLQDSIHKTKNRKQSKQ